ncbi:hypothetical protein ACIQ9Q_13770 [Streptomyces sp. NPDC094438]|uniref:hypothetical protein n=1 Tax=Streptomyces sp. NPDC094438 TaxID=3366061 RepID=UPI00382B3F6C
MEQQPSVVALAHTIALALDGDWRPEQVGYGAESYTHAAALIHPDGPVLHLSERWDEPGYLQVRGAFPVTSYPFRRGDRDSLKVIMADAPEAVAALIQERLMPGYRDAFDRVEEYNAEDAQAREQVEGMARDFSDRLPGARTSVDGTNAMVTLELEPGDIRIGIEGGKVDILLTDAPTIIADAVVFAISRFLPHVQTPADEHGHPVGYCAH